MKNKSFISFCINLLIGVLFSFPVFTAQRNVIYLNINKNECRITESDFGFKDKPKSSGNSCIVLCEERSLKITKNNHSNKNYTPGNKDNSQKSSAPTGFKEHFIFELSQCFSYQDPVFVNLKYLKDLQTTKMLC